MNFTSVDVVEAEGRVELVATIDMWGVALREVLAVPREHVRALAVELAKFLDGAERHHEVCLGGQEYELWTPERSTQPTVCVFNRSVRPDPPKRVAAKVSLPIAMLAPTIARLESLRGSADE